MAKEIDIIEATYPQGKSFTVRFTVQDPSQVSGFIGDMYKENLIHGCTVERVDIRDRVEDYRLKMNRLNAYLKEMVDFV